MASSAHLLTALVGSDRRASDVVAMAQHSWIESAVKEPAARLRNAPAALGRGLRRYDGGGWRAVFFPSGFEHSLTFHPGAA